VQDLILNLTTKMKTNMSELDKIQKGLDDLALALPDGFQWPRELRRTYERATKAVSKLKAQDKKDPAKVS